MSPLLKTFRTDVGCWTIKKDCTAAADVIRARMIDAIPNFPVPHKAVAVERSGPGEFRIFMPRLAEYFWPLATDDDAFDGEVERMVKLWKHGQNRRA